MTAASARVWPTHRVPTGPGNDPIDSSQIRYATGRHPIARLTYSVHMTVDPDPEPALRSPEGGEAQLENARVGYSNAISLLTLEGNLVWARYGLMVLVHTVILTAIGLTSGAPQPARTVTLVGLSLVGLTLCVVWWLVNEIGFRYFFYYAFSARELEERYLSPVRTLSRAFPLTHDKAATISLDGREYAPEVRMTDRSRMVRASNVVIAIIGMLYVALVTILLLV